MTLNWKASQYTSNKTTMQSDKKFIGQGHITITEYIHYAHATSVYNSHFPGIHELAGHPGFRPPLVLEENLCGYMARVFMNWISFLSSSNSVNTVIGKS